MVTRDGPVVIPRFLNGRPHESFNAGRRYSLASRFVSPVIVPLALPRVSLNNSVGHSASSYTRLGDLRDPHLVIDS